MPFHLLDLVADISFQVSESMEVSWSIGCRPSLLLQLGAQVLIFESQHPAVGMIDDDELLCAQQVMGNNQRTQSITGDKTTGIADDMGIADL